MSAILSPDVDRAAWLEARRAGIGASEIAAVLGISPWESPFSLYWRKVNGWDFDASTAMEWGTRLEQAIAQKYADGHPELEMGPGQLEHHAIHPWMLATPDRYLWPVETTRLDVIALLEVKTAHTADGWGEPGTSDIPVYYRAQVLWQMAVVDVLWADVAVLIGGSDYREYTVHWDDKDINVMYEAGRRFMARIENGDPPPIDDHHATLGTLKRLHPDLDDRAAELPPPVASGYLRAVSMVRKAEQLKKRYEIQVRAAMGDAAKATCDGRRVATRVISDIDERTTTVAAHRRDYLLAPREAKK